VWFPSVTEGAAIDQLRQRPCRRRTPPRRPCGRTGRNHQNGGMATPGGLAARTRVTAEARAVFARAVALQPTYVACLLHCGQRALLGLSRISRIERRTVAAARAKAVGALATRYRKRRPAGLREGFATGRRRTRTKRPPTEAALFYFRLHLPARSASSAKRVHSSKCLSHDALLASSLASCASCNAAFAARRYFSDSVFTHSLYQGTRTLVCQMPQHRQ
jgi:hypothetical protein